VRRVAPSSIVIGFSIEPATLAACRPIAVEPVNATRSTPGCLSSASPATDPVPVTTLTTPSGTPARCSSVAMNSADSGVSSAGLCTTTLPAASAGAIFELDRMSGKLNGVIAATTPSGSRRV